MNRKQFLILVALVAVVGVAGWLVHRRGQDSWQAGMGEKLLPGFQVNDTAAITLKSGTNELNLARRDNLWRVRERGDYPANFNQISETLLKFADLKVVQSQEVGPSQLGRFKLLPPGPGTNTATSVEFKDANGKVISSLLLGKKHMKKTAGGSPYGGDDGWPDGRYVMTGIGAGTLALISDPLENIEPNPEQWLSKEFFSIQKPRSISARFPQPTNSWTLTRALETNDWKLADARADEALDPEKISSVTAPFSSASFNDVIPVSARPDAANGTNSTTLTVETFDGFTYSAHIGQKQDDQYPVTLSVSATLPAAAPDKNGKPDDAAKKLSEKLASEKKLEGWVYYVPGYTLDPVLKDKSQLLLIRTNLPAPAAKK